VSILDVRVVIVLARCFDFACTDDIFDGSAFQEVSKTRHKFTFGVRGLD